MKTPIRPPSANLQDIARAVGELCQRVQELEILPSPHVQSDQRLSGQILTVKRPSDSSSETSKQVWL